MPRDPAEVRDGPTTNGNPTIARMTLVFDALLAAPQGLTLDEIATKTGIPRSTAYRILNSLERDTYVRRTLQGRYLLGYRLISLGEAVASDLRSDELRAILLPWMQALADRVGETVRLSIYDRGAVALIAGVAAATSHALNFNLHETLPAHAGGGSKVLLAHLLEEERRLVLRRPLERYTPLTLTDPGQLHAELALIRERGWAHDPGEFSERVQSYAVPLFAGDGRLACAVSIAFARTADPRIHQLVRNAILGARTDAARLISAMA